MELIGKNDLEKKMLANPELQAGLNWGNPRKGHPEGSVKLHVQEIWDKIEELDFNELEVKILRFVALVHDSFKFRVDFKKPKTGDNHHGFIARKFAAEFSEDITEEILEMIQWHDEPYNIHSKLKRDNFLWKERTIQRLGGLLSRPIKNWKVFLEFLKIDGSTGDKKDEASPWFASIISERGKV